MQLDKESLVTRMFELSGTGEDTVDFLLLTTASVCSAACLPLLLLDRTPLPFSCLNKALFKLDFDLRKPLSGSLKCCFIHLFIQDNGNLLGVN